MTGIVYVLTNESMPGLVKIGTATNLKQRLQSLYTTGIPLPFDLHHAVVVEDAAQVEQDLHEAFAPHRINPKREFFEMSPERVVAAMRLTRGESVGRDHVVEGTEEEVEKPEVTEITDADINALNQRVNRRPPFVFTREGIPIGETLTFSRDKTITATVVAPKWIEYDGQKMTLSGSALKILREQYNWAEDSRAAGADYWEYEGELLSERRKRIEREQAESDDE